jgi:hypothetical protein
VEELFFLVTEYAVSDVRHVSFNITDQLLIRYSAVVDTEKKWE